MHRSESSEGEERNPHVFMKISLNGATPELVVIELLADVVPKTAENFRVHCTGERGIGPLTGKPMHYKGTNLLLHPHIGMLGGHFGCDDGTGGETIYGKTFPAETNPMGIEDSHVMMAVNANPGETGSQFAIRFRYTIETRSNRVAASWWFQRDQAVFGKVVDGRLFLLEVEEQDYHYALPMVITDCGQYHDWHLRSSKMLFTHARFYGPSSQKASSHAMPLFPYRQKPFKTGPMRGVNRTPPISSTRNQANNVVTKSNRDPESIELNLQKDVNTSTLSSCSCDSDTKNEVVDVKRTHPKVGWPVIATVILAGVMCFCQR